MKLVQRFSTFLNDHVNLSQGRIDQLDSRVDSVSSFLESGEDEIADRFVATIPQGSYAQRTIINPVDTNDEFDGDILLELTDDGGDWDARDYVQKVYEKFRASARYRDKVSRRSRCVVVNYANEFHIDVVPYLERHGQNYITNRKEDKFELTDPTGFNEWLDTQNRAASGNLVKVLRLLKYLRDYKNTFSVKSVVLTILVGERINSAHLIGDEKHYADAPTTLKNVLVALDDYLSDYAQMPVIADPSGTGETFNHRWNQDEYANFRKWVTHYKDKVIAAYKEENLKESIKKWQEVFGSDFGPLEATVTKAASAVATQFHNTEEDIEQDKGISMVLDHRYSVHVVGRVRAAMEKRLNAYYLSRRGNRVGKNRDIDFTYTTTVPAPYSVYWKVRNFGDEAIAADCIRGQVMRGEPGQVKHEPTKYRGKHYVECYIVKDGVCVARQRHTVIIT